MTKILVTLMAVAFLIVGGMTGVHADGFDGELKLSHPVDSHIKDDTFSFHVDPQYTLDTEVGYTAKCGARMYAGFERIEDIKDTTTFGAEYFIKKSPFGVFVEHANYNMKAGMPDYDLTHAGFVLRYGR